MAAPMARIGSKLPRYNSLQQCTACRTALYRTFGRAFSTSRLCNAQVEPIRAAAPIDIDTLPSPDTSRCRLIPESASYFTGRPRSTDDYLNLQALLRRCKTLPVAAPNDVPRVAWRTLVQYRILVGEPIKPSRYHRVIEILQRLNKIHPAVAPPDLTPILNQYKRKVDPFAVHRKPTFIDEDGKACGLGRRKASSAKVYLVQGEGKVLVNGKSINTIFGRVHDRESALWALNVTRRTDKYNVWALVSGGGTTGQAEAIALGVAKALMIFEPALKPALRRAGCVTRDARRVERKKPGHVKARKMPTWVKR